MITYYKLLDMLNRQGMTREQLKRAAGLSSATMTKISKQESVTLKTIDSICRIMNCQPGDILQYNDMSYEDFATLQTEKKLKSKENL